MKIREAQLNIRLTQEEDRKFRKLAESKHMKLSEFVRLMLHREADAENGKAA